MVSTFHPVWLRIEAHVTTEPQPDALLRAIAESADKQAFAALYALAAPKVKAFLLRATRGNDTLSAELTQEVMLRVWKRARSFNPERGTAMGWIYSIARNARIDHARRKRPEADGRDPVLVDDSPKPDEATSARQRAARVREALDDLPEAQAFILERAYFDGASLGEIATQTDTPLGTVKSRVRLAMKRLRGTLEDTR